MTLEELRKMVAEICSAQSESDTVEVKKAHGGTPKRRYEAMSAFANRTGGGIIVFAWMSQQIFQSQVSAVPTDSKKISRAWLPTTWNPPYDPSLPLMT